jgi:hypothetical protein
MARYITGFNNYRTHEDAEEAKRNLCQIRCDAVLQKHADGSASIIFLQNQPVQHGQVPYTEREA